MSKTIKVVIPSSISEVTVDQYQQYIGYVSKLDDGADENAVNKKMISIFTNIDEKLIGKMPNAQVIEAISALSNVLNGIGSKNGLISRFSIGEVEFGFIPDLEKATFDEYVDSDTYFKSYEDLHRWMAVVYRPVTEKRKMNGRELYNIEEYEESSKYSDIMKQAPLNVLLGAQSFFESLGMKLLQVIPSYLESQLENPLIAEYLRTLQQDGIGTDVTMSSLEEMSRRLGELVKQTSGNV